MRAPLFRTLRLNKVLPGAISLGAGWLAGGYLLSAVQQFAGTFGVSEPFSIAVLLSGAVAMVLAIRWTAAFPSVGFAHLALALWTVALPWITDAIAVAVGAIPLGTIANPFVLWTAALATGMLLLAPPFFLAARLFLFPLTVGRLASVACGVLFVSWLIAPVVGLQIFAVVCVLASMAVFLWELLGPSQASFSEPISADESLSLWTQGRWTILASCAGLLFVLLERMVHQLMPVAGALVTAEWAGLLLGAAAGCALSRILRADAALVAAFGAVLILLGFPWLVDGSLWMNANVAFPYGLVLIRMLIVCGMMLVPGWLMAAVLSSRSRRVTARSIPSFVFGVVLGQVWLVPAFGVGPILLIVIWSLIAAAVLPKLPIRRSARWSAGLVTAGACGLALLATFGPSTYNPARAARLLFSTQVFLAQRAGFGSRLLPFLDEGRLVAQVPGARGPWTVWKHRGSELQIRENGIPRGSVTIHVGICPQAAGEVLQATLPLVLHERPLRVLALGLGTGVPTSTSLRFPVQQLTCVESDAGPIDVVRHVVARETGFDPLSDDRVTLLRLPPEIALRSDRGQYDVILSSPGQSSLWRAAPWFTLKFYRQAARRLATDGIFCQRFECIDYGPEPLQLVVKTMQSAFANVVAVEAGVGDILLLATNSPRGLARPELISRLTAPHVTATLARCGWDWSVLLNLPAYRHESLTQLAAESRAKPNTSLNGLLTWQGPLEVLRWGPKPSEVQQVLTKADRRSRLLEWIGDDGNAPDVLQRLAEVVTQQKLIAEHPDAHWWEYRKVLRERLQSQPSGRIRQVSAVTGTDQLSESVERRKAYLAALGQAVQKRTPGLDEIAAVEEFATTFDPLISLFMHQELADLYARSEPRTVERELAHRLHLVYYSAAFDSSVRDVIAALDLLNEHPESLPDEVARWDQLNALLQMLQNRWVNRIAIRPRSARIALRDVERSIVAIEQTFETMQHLTPQAGLSASDWEARQAVLERTLARPLRTYRSRLQRDVARSKAQAEAVRENRTSPNQPAAQNG